MKYKFKTVHIVILLILVVFIVFSVDYAEYTLPIAAFVLTIFYFFYSNTSCPRCHRLHAKKKIGKETIDYMSKFSERDFDTSDASFYTKKIHNKCKYCNHQWDEEKLVGRH